MTNTDFEAQDISTHLRVLVADDVQETRRSTRLILTLNPDIEIVAIVRDGQQAIDMAKVHKPDIAILDINMPKVDGISAFRFMHQANPNIVGIIISVKISDQQKHQAMSMGVREYLIKPSTVDDLNLALRRASKTVFEQRRKAAKITQVRAQSETFMEQLAQEYAKSRRSDDQAMEVFESLAANPGCKLRWLKILAMIYVVRQQWGKLITLAERLKYQEGHL